MISVLALSMLVGCGKSKEEKEFEKAQNEFQDAINKEMQENPNPGQAAMDRLQEKADDSNELYATEREINNTIDKYELELRTILDEFNDGDERADYQQLADAYNSTFAEADQFAVDNQATNKFKVTIKEIPQRLVEWKLRFPNLTINHDYNTTTYAYDDQADQFIIIFQNVTGYQSMAECTFWFEDGRTCYLDASPVNDYNLAIDNNATKSVAITLGKVTIDKASIDHCFGGAQDATKHSFDITGETAVATGEVDSLTFGDYWDNIENGDKIAIDATGITGINRVVKLMLKDL